MYKNIIIIFITIMMQVSCSDQKKIIPTVDVAANVKNMQQINLSEFSDSVYYTCLQKVEGIFLEGIYESDFSNNYILISDNNECLLYNRDGVFVSRLGKKGRGPGEFNHVNNLGICADNKFYIQSLYDLLEYNVDGSFLRKYEKTFLINDDYISAWRFLNDSLILGKVSRYKGNEKFRALIFNRKGQVIYSIKNLSKIDRKCPMVSNYENYANIYSFKNNLYFKERHNDTLFSLSDKGQFDPILRFNFGKYSLPDFKGTRDELVDYVSKEENSIYLDNVYQTSDFLFLDYQFNKYFPEKRINPINMGNYTAVRNTSSVLGIFEKKTNKLLLCKPTSTDNPLFTTGFYNDIDAGPRFFPMKQINDSTMVMWVGAKQLKEHVASDDFKNAIPKNQKKKKELENLAYKLTEFDNPVLMFVTFKK